MAVHRTRGECVLRWRRPAWLLLLLSCSCAKARQYSSCACTRHTRVVQGGALELRGMPKFEELEDAQVEALRHYLRQRARDSR